MKRTLALILTMLMVVTMIPASLLNVLARGPGVTANGIQNQTVSNAPDQYIPETIVVDGKVRDTGWPYDDWNKVNDETGTWNIQDVAAENRGLVYSYQLKTDYYFLYGAFILEKEVEGPITIYLNNGQGDNTYTHKFVIDVSEKVDCSTGVADEANDMTFQRLAANGTRITSRSTYAYDRLAYAINKPAPGRTVVEFKTHLADFCSTKSPKISYFVSVGCSNSQALFHPAIKSDILNRDSYFPSLTGEWPEGAGVISTQDLHGTGKNSLDSAITVDGKFNEAIFADHTNFYSVWYERLNVVDYKKNDKPYSDLVYNKLDYDNDIRIGAEHDVRVSASMFYGAALVQDNDTDNSTLDTSLIFNLYQYVDDNDVSQGTHQLQIIIKEDFNAQTTSYSATYLAKGAEESVDVTAGLKFEALPTGAPSTYAFEFSFDRTLAPDFIPDYYDLYACAYTGGAAYNLTYATFGGGYKITHYCNSDGVYHEPYTTYTVDGYLGNRAWPGLTVSASTVNANLIDNDETHGGTRVRGLDYFHTMALDYEFAYGAVHITDDKSGTFTSWKHGNANNPNGADYFSVLLSADSGTTVVRYDMWTYEDGGEVKAVIGKHNGNNVAYDFSDELKVAFASTYDEDLQRYVYAFEYGVSLHHIGISLDYNQSTADVTTSLEILQYYVMLNIVNVDATYDSSSYAAHTNYVWPKSDNSVMPGADGFTWSSNPAVIKYNSVVRTVECDGKITEELRLQLETIDYKNSDYREPSLKGNVLGGHKKVYVGHDYIYLATRFDGQCISMTTKVTLWVKNNDGTIKSYTFLYNENGNDGKGGNESYFNGSSTYEYVTTSAFAMTTANDATNFEVVFPISHIDPNREGFEYFVEIQQRINGELLNRVSPAPVVEKLEEDTYATYFDLNGSEWSKHAGTPDSLVYFIPETIDVDGDIMDSGWDDEEWIFVSPDINASRQETNEITQLFKSDFYYQMRFDEEFVYVAAVIKYYDGTNPDTGATITADEANILNQEPSFRVWLKKGQNSEDSTVVGSSNTYTSYYNVQLAPDGSVRISCQENLFPTYANNTRPLTDKYYNYVIPQIENGNFVKDENGQIIFKRAENGESFSTYTKYDNYENFNPNGSLLFGYTKYNIKEEEAYVINEKGQTFGETLNPEQYKDNNMLDGDPVTGVESATMKLANGKTFVRNGNIVNLDSSYVTVEMKVKISEYKLNEFFQYYVSTGMHAPLWNGSKATVYPSIAVEPNSGDNYFHQNFPYWYWKDGAAVNVSESLRQDMTLRTYKKPVITLGAKVNEKYNYYNPDKPDEGIKEVNAIRLGGLWTEEYIRKVNGLMETDGYNNGNYTDYWDVQQMGMIIKPTHLTGYNTYENDPAHPGNFDLFADTTGAAVVDAESIVKWVGANEGGDPKNDFADYTDFAFYVTVVNVPTAMNFCFRGFVTYYQDVNGSLPYYDVVLERSINSVVDQAATTGKFDWAESGALEDGEFLDETYRPGTGAVGSDLGKPSVTPDPEDPENPDPEDPDDPVVPNVPPQPDNSYNIDSVNTSYAASGTYSKLYASNSNLQVIDTSAMNFNTWAFALLEYDEKALAYKVIEVKPSSLDEAVGSRTYGGNIVAIAEYEDGDLKNFINSLVVGEYVQITGATLSYLRTHISTEQETTIGIGRVDIDQIQQDVVIESIELSTTDSAEAGNLLFDINNIKLDKINGSTAIAEAYKNNLETQWYDEAGETPLYHNGTIFEQGVVYDLFFKLHRLDGYKFADDIDYTLTTADGTYKGVEYLKESTEDIHGFDFYITGLEAKVFESVTITPTYKNPQSGTAITEEGLVHTIIWSRAGDNKMSVLGDLTDNSGFDNFNWFHKALLEHVGTYQGKDLFRVLATNAANGQWGDEFSIGQGRVVIMAHPGYVPTASVISSLKNGEYLVLDGTTITELESTNPSEGALTNVTFTTVDYKADVIVTVKEKDSEVTKVNPGELTVLYVPLDDRPVHTDRVKYLAAASGINLEMPPEEIYKTVMPSDTEDGGDTNPHGGDTSAMLQWLKDNSGKYDYFVIALDQVFSGGLVTSRVVDPNFTGKLTEQEIATADFLVELASDPKNYVVFTDTVVRLAPTVGFDNKTETEYNILRDYGKLVRPTFDGTTNWLGYGSEEFTIENVISVYDYDGTGVTQLPAPSGVTEADYEAYLNTRERKLRIIDYLVRRAGKNIDHLFVGVDDADSAHNIAKLDKEYIENLVSKYGTNATVFAGADEMGVMGITTMTSFLYNFGESEQKVPVNVTYYGDGKGYIADKYDTGTLEESVNKHLEAIGAYQVESAYKDDPGVIQILVLTRANSSTESTGDASYQASLLAAQVKINLAANIPTIVIDASNHYGGCMNYAIEAMYNAGVVNGGQLGKLLAFSKWNTVGNTVGLGISSGVARYNYLVYADEVTEESNVAFLKYLMFTYIKDVVYRREAGDNATDATTFWTHAETNQEGYSSNWFVTWLDENVMFGKYIKNQGFTTNEYSYTVTLGNPVWPWNREFEVRFDIDIQ